MYTIEQRREIAARIAEPSQISTYRRLLKTSGSPYAGLINTNEKKWAIQLVSALLTIYTESEILAATLNPQSAAISAAAPSKRNLTPPANAAVKKNALKFRSIREFPGTIWTILSSGLRTLFSRTR